MKACCESWLYSLCPRDQKDRERFEELHVCPTCKARYWIEFLRADFIEEESTYTAVGARAA